MWYINPLLLIVFHQFFSQQREAQNKTKYFGGLHIQLQVICKMLNHRQAFLRWAKKQSVCGIILEVCRFNTERPLSGIIRTWCWKQKKRHHSGHHTPHHHTPHWPTAKHSAAGKHKARRGKKNDYNSQRGKSVSGLFCSGSARRLHFLFPHFCPLPTHCGLSWLTQTN